MLEAVVFSYKTYLHCVEYMNLFDSSLTEQNF
jgi:hypothetical protein